MAVIVAMATATLLGVQALTIPPISPPVLETNNTHSLWKTNQSSKAETLRSICGLRATKELISYAKYHDKILQNKLPPRYLYSVAVEAGFADRLTGIISLFWLAFLSKHAFQIGFHHKLPLFQSAYDPIFINWIKPDFSELYETPLLFTYEGIRGNKKPRKFPSSANLRTHHFEYLINDFNKTKRLFRYTNLTQYPSSHSSKGESYVYASSNRGGTHLIYRNPYLKEYFQKTLRLPAANIFRCGYHFLFHVNDAVGQLVSELWSDVTPLTTSSVFSKMFNKSTESQNKFVSKTLPEEEQGRNYSSSVRVGIGVRVGDRSFTAKADALTEISRYSETLQCAEDIEVSLRDLIPKSNQSAVWVFQSESLRLRQLVKRHYGKKKIVIVDAKTSYFHGDCQRKMFHDNCDPSHLSSAIQVAVAQFTLFSLCDIHIFYGNSGFHRLGALVSKSPHFIYIQPDSTKCSLRNRLSWRSVSQMGCRV